MDCKLQEKKLWEVKAGDGKVRKYVFRQDAVAAIKHHKEHGRFPDKKGV